MAPLLTRTQREEERQEAITLIEAELDSFGYQLHHDSKIRAGYNSWIKKEMDQIKSDARRKVFNWEIAARKANEVRNQVMKILRDKSHPVGRAFAESLKKDGVTLNQMIARKMVERGWESIPFGELKPVQKERIYKEVVISAAKSRPSVNKKAASMSRFGRGLLLISLAISIHEIAGSENKMQAAAKEAATTASGIAGGVAGGAIAGLACGPGAPVCVTIGMFVGGALAAYATDSLWWR